MFERFTESARQAVFYARYESSVAGSDTIKAHHLLLGLLRSDTAMKQRVLGNSSLEDLRGEFGETGRSGVSSSADIPLGLECKRALAYGAEEAERAASKFIRASHLIAGLLRDDTPARSALQRRGIELEDWRSEFIEGPRGGISVSIKELLSELPEDRTAAAVRILNALREPSVTIQVMTDAEDFTIAF